MVIDCGAQRFKVCTRAACPAPRLDIGTALGRGDLGQRLAAPVIVKPTDGPLQLWLIANPWPAVVEVDRQYVGDVNPFDIFSEPKRLIFVGNIRR
jgi:hypothetical protein